MTLTTHNHNQSAEVKKVWHCRPISTAPYVSFAFYNFTLHKFTRHLAVSHFSILLVQLRKLCSVKLNTYVTAECTEVSFVALS